ncbi:MAG TPA: ATP-binding protein [Mycobacteriales bacterium]|nr:ATP-binding protein [Mycobacteriales bacterium]
MVAGPDDERLELALPGIASSVAEARSFVRGAMRSWGLPELVDTVALLTSELATNAVLHARTPYVLLVERVKSGGRKVAAIRVTVFDESERIPTQREGTMDRTTGRGLALVDALARAWGTTGPGARAKGVWFELAIRAEADVRQP